MASAVFLTSTFLRHQFVANVLASRIDILGVWQEKKTFVPDEYAGSDDDRRVIGEHFAKRDASEELYFGADKVLKLSPGVVHRVVGGGGTNQSDEILHMRTLNPDLLLVFGTGILREEIITAFRGRIINIHLGLSPYYRGSGTNFWPLVNGEPEYVGATIHSLDSGIDTGDIFLHVRPDIAPDDGPHDIGNKAIQAAADGLALVAERFVQGGLPSVPQSGKGRFYQRKDFSADAVRTLYERFEKGMIPEYLAHRAECDARLSLVSLPL